MEEAKKVCENWKGEPWVPLPLGYWSEMGSSWIWWSNTLSFFGGWRLLRWLWRSITFTYCRYMSASAASLTQRLPSTRSYTFPAPLINNNVSPIVFNFPLRPNRLSLFWNKKDDTLNFPMKLDCQKNQV